MGDRLQNPQAFPKSSALYDGMTLRDYFAGQALAGMLAMPETTTWGNFHSNGGKDDAAQYAYAMADAMLRERSK